MGALVRSSYSIVEAVFAEPLSLAVRKFTLCGNAWLLAALCALLAASYCAIAFLKSSITVLVMRFFQAALLLMDSLALTQVTQAMQPPDQKRLASNQAEIVLNVTATVVHAVLFILQTYDISTQHQFVVCASICTVQSIAGLICVR